MQALLTRRQLLLITIQVNILLKYMLINPHKEAVGWYQGNMLKCLRVEQILLRRSKQVVSLCYISIYFI